MGDNLQISGAVVGVGIDLADVARIRGLMEKYGDTFLSRTFSATEIKTCLSRAEPAVSLAARFAAKEAIVKALSTGFSGDITMQSVWIENGANGEPIAHLDTAAQLALEKIGGSKILVSLTHLKDYAQAIAIAIK